MRYCKSTIFQANHNANTIRLLDLLVVCDTAKVRFFKQITTSKLNIQKKLTLFAILQKYDFSSKSQPSCCMSFGLAGCLRYCKSTIFQANHNRMRWKCCICVLFAILQKYDFSSKSQQDFACNIIMPGCLRYCKSTIFQANHNVQCVALIYILLFAILQKYDFSSKSQLSCAYSVSVSGCLRYCKSTIFQANHNAFLALTSASIVVCDTAKVRFFKQITTTREKLFTECGLFAILQKYDFSSKSQPRC